LRKGISSSDDNVAEQTQQSSRPDVHVANSSSDNDSKKDAEPQSAKNLPVLTHATVQVPRNQQGDGNGMIDRDENVRQSVEAILGQPSMVVTREMEMLNVFMGYEQANRYAIVTPDGHQLGYLAESENGLLGGALRRQFLRTHRAFEAHIMDTSGRVVLTIKRPTTMINSRLKVFIAGHDDGEGRLVGEVHQVWHPLRRKYELFVNRPEINEDTTELEDSLVQFASIDGGLLTWDFVMTDQRERPLGAITRNFRGFGREIFTDTGQYVLTFDPTTTPDLQLEPPANTSQQQGNSSTISSSSSGRELVTSGPVRQLTMDERAVALATAISVDFDYFSRHSSHGHGSPGMAMFPWMWGGGGGGASAEPAPSTGSGVGTEVPSADGASTGELPNSASPPSSDQGDASAGPSWWEGQPSESSSQEGDSWGFQDPWQQGSSSGGGAGGESGWSWTDLFPGDD
jgi:hypothetical protein